MELLHLVITYFNPFFMRMKLLWSVLLIGAVPVFFSGCKDDDEVKPSGVQFEEESLSVSESDGTITSFHPLQWQQFSGSTAATGREINIKLTLDRAMPETSVIQYALTGNAKKNSASAIGDYDTNGDLLVIEKGSTEATLSITLFEDFGFEYDENSLDADGFPLETIIVTLQSVVSGPAELGEKKVFTLNVYEDDALVFLNWDPQDDATEDQPGDVDMDLFVWHEDEIVRGSATNGPESEATNIPAGFPSGTYGLSYNYYSGTSNNLELTVDIINFGGTINGTSSEYTATSSQNLTLANKNPYDQTDVDPIIVQTIEKSGLNYPTVSSITRPASGSRKSSNFDGATIREKLKNMSVPRSLLDIK
jgi:hypothetical protein